MKFSNFERATLAAVLSLGAVAPFVGCGSSLSTDTVDYIFVTNSKSNPGGINVYYADADSGALTPVPGSPFSSGGANPVALATSPNFKNLYVLNRDDNSIVEFAIAANGTVSQQNKYQTPGSSPNAMTINTAGTFLFVTDTVSPDTNSKSGVLAVYPINSDGSLGTAVSNGSLSYYPLSANENNVLNPTAVNVLTNSSQYVYVVNQNASTGLGSISAFGVGSSGALTAIPCSTSASICSSNGDGTFNAGTSPNAIASTPKGLFVYVTDSATNQLISYTVQSSGQIIPSQIGPTKTDVFPDAVVVDPRGQYVYVANYNAADISAYTINTATGYPTGVAAAGTYSTGGPGPTCIFVDPAVGRYVYTTNFLDGSIGGQRLNPNSGALTATQNSPYLAAGQPTCMAGIPHGNHAISAPVT